MSEMEGFGKFKCQYCLMVFGTQEMIESHIKTSHVDKKVASPSHLIKNLGKHLPEDSEARKGYPICTGVLDYFPAAIAYVAKISKLGNDKHNPGEPLHWARGKSMDHADCVVRHLIDRGTKDENGIWHDGYEAWRALAQLQELLEREEGAPKPRGAW